MTFIDMGALLPSIEVCIDFANDPASASETWTDVTPYVRAYETSIGRENELAQSTPGRLSLLLDNTDRRFDPTNTAGPYYPNVLPNRRVRVRAQWAGVTYNRFRGFIDDWPLSWPEDGYDAIVQVTATDSFKPTNLYDLGGKSYGAQRTDQRLGTVFYDVGFGTASYSLLTGQSSVVASGTIAVGQAALAHVQEVVTSENGVLFQDAGGTIQFQDRHYRILHKSASQGTIGDAAGEIPYVDPIVPYGDAYLWNIAKVTPSGGTAETAIDAASTASHWGRALTRSILVSSQAEALSCAQYLVSRYATPSLRVDGVTLVPAGTAYWPTVLGMMISDRYTFKRRQIVGASVGGTISFDAHIEKIGDSVSRGRDYTMSLRLSPAETQSYWVLGDAVNSQLGDTTRLGY